MRNLISVAGIVLVALPLYAAGDTCVGQEIGTHVPHESDCALFYFCDGNGHAELRKCIDGDYFDPTWRYCRPISEVTCAGSSTVATPSPTPTQTPAPTPSPSTAPTPSPSTAPTPSPSTASTPSPSTASTPSPSTSSTPSPSTAPTPSPNTGSTPSSSTSSTPSTTPSGGLTGSECSSPSAHGDLLPYPGDCNHFIQCTHSKAVVMKCPSSLHFNEVLKVCDWPEDAGCGNASK